MIDFRYHLVSLISVFLALAVGIVLGAGPLKETIGDTLTGQVSQLREEKDALRADLDLAEQRLAESTSYLEAVSGTLLDGALAERRIGLVLLDEVPASALEAIEEALARAGASVPTTVRLTERWTSPEDQVFRSALAARLAEYLEPPVEQSAGVHEVLAAALAQAIAGKDPARPTARSANAQILGDLLTAEDGLVEAELEDDGPVDAVVVLSWPEPAPEPAADGEAPAEVASPDEAVLRAQAAVVLAAQQRSEGAILAAGEYREEGLVALVRGDEELAERLSTVTGADEVAGRLDLVLGLGARIGLQVGHYGFDAGATAPAAPRVELPPVDRTPAAVPEDGDSRDEDGDPGDGEQGGEADEDGSEDGQG